MDFLAVRTHGTDLTLVPRASPAVAGSSGGRSRGSAGLGGGVGGYSTNKMMQEC